MTARVAILGNSFARKVQLPALRWAAAHGAPNEVVAIAGRDGEKARATADAFGIAVATDAWEEALDPARVGDLDLVVVSTPVDLHAPMVRGALERTRAAILCEKPFAMDGDEARALAGEARGRLALIDHQTRWSPWRRAFAREVAVGRSGDPWAARVHLKVASVPRIGAGFGWWYDAERGGGTLGALASHALDGIVDQFGSPVAAVRANLMTHVRERPDAAGEPVAVTSDESAHLWLELESGLDVQVETGVLDFGVERDAGNGVLCELRGAEATLRLEGETTLVRTPHGGAAEAVALDAPELPTNEELGVPGMGFFARCLPGYLRDVLRAAVDGEATLAGAADFDSAVHVTDVIDAARLSSREGRRVEVRRDG